MPKLNHKIKFTLTILICSLLFSCNSKDTGTDTSNYKLSFLSGNEFTKETLNKIINDSKLTKGGYVVIIPTSVQANDPNAQELRIRFFKNQIVAVHLISFEEGVKRSDILAIENASLVCIVGDDIHDFVKFAYNSKLASTFSNAFEKGAAFFTVGNASKILGKEYISTDTTIGKNQPIRKNNGLGILKNFVIYNELDNEINYKEMFDKSKEGENIYLMGLNDTSCVLINDSTSAEIIHGNVTIKQPGESSIALKQGTQLDF